MNRLEECVPFRPEPWVDAAMLPDGRLELSSRAGGDVFHCEPAAAAMWIALCQHDWQVGAAAGALASAWRIDAVNMRADLDILVAELCDAGLLGQRV
ncbi:MAG: PqqD family peptide modification chaperone [Kibdelosporangium sp.]